MANEILITPQNEFGSSLLEETYYCLEEFSPLYKQRMLELAEAFKSKMYDDYGPCGWGTFTHSDFLTNPNVLTGRGFCIPSAIVIAEMLLNKFPRLDIQKNVGRAYKFNPEGLTPAQEIPLHHRLKLTDPNLNPESVLSSVAVCGTVQQIDPESAFILFTNDESYIQQLYSPQIKTYPCLPNSYMEFDFGACFTFNAEKSLYNRQVEACSRFLNLVNF